MPVSNGILDKEPVPYKEIREQVRNGDILLASGNYAFSKLIRFGTNSPWSHCALVIRLDSIDRIVVLESVEDAGLRAVPLSSYCRDYEGTGKAYEGKVVLARNTQLSGSLQDPKNLKLIASFAFDYLGHPYATDDILRITARIAAGKIGLQKDKELEPKDGVYICSEFVAKCAEKVGSNVGARRWGFVSPDDVAQSCDSEIARIV